MEILSILVDYWFEITVGFLALVVAVSLELDVREWRREDEKIDR